MAGFYDTPGMTTNDDSGTGGAPQGGPGTGTGQPTNGPTGGANSGGFNISNWLPQSLGGTGTPSQSMLIPSWLSAYQQYKNADKYTGMAEKYATQLDPFGSQRPIYQDQIRQAQADPAGYISSLPSYQAALRLGLGATNRGALAKTGGVSNADDISFASDLASKTWDSEMNRLGHWAGADIGPNSAADILKTGMLGNIQSGNAALQAMMFPFGPSASGTTVNNMNGQRPGGSNAPGTAGNAAGQLNPFRYGQAPDGSPLDKNGQPAPYGIQDDGTAIDPNGGYGPGYGDNPQYDIQIGGGTPSDSYFDPNQYIMEN